MTGDWVRLQYNHFITEELVTKDFQVTEIRDGGETNHIFGKDGNMGMVEHIQPIPLTAEILEKNGFKKYGDTGWWLEDNFFDIHIYEWSDSIWVFKYESTEMNTPYEQRTFSYVHNLQHALRECGTDKEIVL